jgi:hypothetical protein
VSLIKGNEPHVIFCEIKCIKEIIWIVILITLT